MLSIDEAIENEKSRAENCKGHYDRFVQMEAKEHEQIAEWLELLKWYEQGMEDIPCESGVLPEDVYHAGYNKAIDDAKSVVLQTLDNGMLVDTLHLRLEQLKEGVR